MGNYLYILGARNVDVVKVGITTNKIQRRMQQLQTGCPYKLFLLRFLMFPKKENLFKYEKCVHFFLESYKLSGEWFKLPPIEMLDEVLFKVADYAISKKDWYGLEPEEEEDPSDIAYSQWLIDTDPEGHYYWWLKP